MSGLITGSSARLTTGTEPSTVATLIGAARGPKRKVTRVLLYCPDGNDPGIAANTDTVFAGPAGSSAWPIRPGGRVVFTNVDPWAISIQCATAAQLVFIAWGGDTPVEA